MKDSENTAIAHVYLVSDPFDAALLFSPLHDLPVFGVPGFALSLNCIAKQAGFATQPLGQDITLFREARFEYRDAAFAEIGYVVEFLLLGILDELLECQVEQKLVLESVTDAARQYEVAHLVRLVRQCLNLLLPADALGHGNHNLAHTLA